MREMKVWGIMHRSWQKHIQDGETIKTLRSCIGDEIDRETSFQTFMIVGSVVKVQAMQQRTRRRPRHQVLGVEVRTWGA